MDTARRIVLLRFERPAADKGPGPAEVTVALAAAGFLPRDLVVHQPVEPGPCYGYLLPAPERRSVDEAAFRRLRESLARHLPSAQATRLLAMMEIEGASAGLAPTHHYVVETDVVAAAEGDLNAWYDEEHLPGLAAVPGTVRAARYRNLDDGPRYHACYELASRHTLGSPAWLEVRGTAWSAKVRPMFVNARRIMFSSPG